MLKSTGTRYTICRQTSDDGIRNKEQHEGKGKGWACNNHNMRNPSLHLFLGGGGGVTHVMIVACYPLPLHSAPYF